MQIDYEKIILGLHIQSWRRHHTKVAINDLAKNFICFKFDQETADRFETAVQAACVTQRKRKRQDLVVEIDSSSDRKEGSKCFI